MLDVYQMCCGYGATDVVKDISFHIERGSIVCLAGPNGCGKTTTLRAVAGLLDYRGNVALDRQEVKFMKRRTLAKKIAVMTQMSDLYFPYTVYDTVAMGRYAHIKSSFASLTEKDKACVDHCLEQTGMTDCANTMIDQLSGGQLQRVFLARAFAQDPEILLLDEPTNHLDLKYQIEILEYIKNWTVKEGKTVVAVLHDLNLVQSIADDVILMKEGRIFRHGKPFEVLQEDVLEECYGINITKWMLQSLSRWQ